MLSLSGHIFHAPRASARCTCARARINPLLYGGARERKQRPAPENIASIVAMGVAIEHAASTIESRNATCCRFATG